MRNVTIVAPALLLGLALPAACAATDVKAAQAGDKVQEAYRLRIDGKVDEAKQALDAEVAAHPDSAAAWFELSRLDFYRSLREGEGGKGMDQAQVEVEKAVELAPDNARYHAWAGQLAMYCAIGKAHSKKMDDVRAQMKKAADALEQAIAKEPGRDEARLLLVYLYGNNPPDLGGDRDKAEAQVKALEARSPVLGTKARCDFSVEEPAERIALWQGLAEKLSQDPAVHENLAHEYARSGDDDKAVAEADRALALDPARVRVLLDVGLALGHAKSLDPAETLVQRYLDNAGSEPAALRAYGQFLLGKLQDMKGDKEAIGAALKKAREIDPYCWFTMQPPAPELFEAL
ncbi:MAG: tetratricopeptide repeat protein [Planctomycetes bacterium]|nr:tetratricopeptide repeat protein [Planctomycetota bacterium]